MLIIFTLIQSNMELLNNQLIGRFQHYTDLCKKVYCQKIGHIILLLKILHVAKGDLLGFVTSAQPTELEDQNPTRVGRNSGFTCALWVSRIAPHV